MSKKDYIAIAVLIAGLPSVVSKQQVIEELVTLFSELNPNFNEDKFREACGK